MIIDDREYTVLMGSDLERDGMFLELCAGSQPNGDVLAECFCSDRDGSITLTQYANHVPESALAWLRVAATGD